jgi:hypothetical protein
VSRFSLAKLHIHTQSFSSFQDQLHDQVPAEVSSEQRTSCPRICHWFPTTPFLDNFRIADLNEAARAADATREVGGDGCLMR